MTNIDYKTQLETLIGLIDDKLNIEAIYDACESLGDFPMAVKLQEENLEAAKKLRDYIATIKSPMMKPIKPKQSFNNRWI